MKKLIFSLMFLLMTILVLPLNTFAAPVMDVQVNVYQLVDTLMIYPNKDCSFALSNDASVAPAPGLWNTCDSLGDYIPVDVSQVSNGDARYLWLTGNEEAYDLQTYNILSSTDADYIGTTAERIKVAHGVRKIDITDTDFTDLKYIIVKVEAGTPYDQLVMRASNISPTKVNESKDPFATIASFLAFQETYNSLVPGGADDRWTAVVDNVIEEPLDTQDGWIYVVWIMGTDGSGESVLDMQIMFCEREDVRDYRVEMPYTGMGYLLEGLIGTNLALLPVIYLRRKKLVENN